MSQRATARVNPGPRGKAGQRKGENSMRTERWCFTDAELQEPESCRKDDEFMASVYLHGHKDTQVVKVIVYRNGQVTNRWGDGCKGVPENIRRFVEDEDTLSIYAGNECASNRRDVLVNDDGSFHAFA